MELDVDDTVTVGKRPSVTSIVPDLDDTVVLSSRQRPASVKPYKRAAGSEGGASAAKAPVAAPQSRTVPEPSSVSVRARPIAPSAPRVESNAPQLHYQIQLDGTESIYNLERACVFGRDPRPPRIVNGVGPLLISVDSRLREVSETHVEVRQLGSSVIVTDLRSTNGSIVQVPGNPARKLRQGESVVVSTGTLVDIGDGNIIRILPRQRLE